MKELRGFTNGKNESCVFTGHRNLEKDFSERALLKIIKNAVKSGISTFYSGMAIGFDLTAAELLLSLKRKNPDIRLVACIPCEEQDKYYSKEDKKRYRAVLEKVDEKIVLSPRYYQGCMHVRDRYMAERADGMIAYCKREEGGTAYTVKCFQKLHPEGEIVFVD